jgi:hypothetical protein
MTLTAPIADYSLPGWPMLAGSGGAQIIYSAAGYQSAAPRRCGITAQSAASGL